MDAPTVRLVDLEVIKRFSLAVRAESAPASEVLAALDASRAAVLEALGSGADQAAVGRDRPRSAAKTAAAKTAAKATAARTGSAAKTTAAKKAVAKKAAAAQKTGAAKSGAAKSGAAKSTARPRG
jgi:RNA polymerase primary sigma factor